MKNDITEHVALAWELICRYDLSSEVKLPGLAKPASRFILVDAKGITKMSPYESVAIMDMVSGQTFLPQFDSAWFEQLVDRFRVSVNWIEDSASWSATVGKRGDTLVNGYGKTPGVAVVDALVNASRSGNPPIKHEFRAG